MRCGDAIVIFSMWVWLTVSVGPWWVGVGLLAIGWGLNALTKGVEV